MYICVCRGLNEKDIDLVLDTHPRPETVAREVARKFGPTNKGCGRCRIALVKYAEERLQKEGP